jgi:type IV secretion system protein VirB10
MSKVPRRGYSTYCVLVAAALFLLPQLVRAQEPPGPQAAPPPAVTPAQPAAQQPQAPSQLIRIPAGTHIAVVLENGISTGSAKAGDSVYFHTSFPITQDNHIVIPVGSYLRGELIESKRPGKVKGRGEFRMRLDTLIFPNGYTVDLNATPRSADTGGKETMDSEGKITSAGGKGQDVKTVAETTATGAGIGAIADGPKGLGIGSGIGAVAGLGAVLLTRGPEAHLPRGSALDVVLEHELTLDKNQIRYTDTGRAMPITPPPASQQ